MVLSSRSIRPSQSGRQRHRARRPRCSLLDMMVVHPSLDLSLAFEKRAELPDELVVLNRVREKHVHDCSRPCEQLLYYGSHNNSRVKSPDFHQLTSIDGISNKHSPVYYSKGGNEIVQPRTVHLCEITKRTESRKWTPWQSVKRK
jgi:hypothetical protein